MNSKKAKRLRQLVRVMQDKGVVEKEWTNTGHVKHAVISDEQLGTSTLQRAFADAVMPPKLQSMLKPECGRAVYQGMKKRYNESI